MSAIADAEVSWCAVMNIQAVVDNLDDYRSLTHA